MCNWLTLFGLENGLQHATLVASKLSKGYNTGMLYHEKEGRQITSPEVNVRKKFHESKDLGTGLSMASCLGVSIFLFPFSSRL